MDEDGLVLEHPRNVEEGPVCARIVPSHQGTLVRPRLIEHRERALRLIVRGDASRLERLYPAKDPKGPRGPPVAASGGEVRTAAIEVLQFRRGAEIGRAHVCTPATSLARMPSSARNKKEGLMS